MVAVQETSNSTHAIRYTILTTERQCPVPNNPGHCRKLVVAALGAPIRIPCFQSDRFSQLDDYLHNYRHRFANVLRLQYPPGVLPYCCAARVAHTFTSILRSANAAHLCGATELTSVTNVQISIEFLRAFSFEEAGPGEKPSVAGLIEERLLLEEAAEGGELETRSTDRPCVFCMEEIETREDSLRMPCSHMFHYDCLVKWFLTNHDVCPLCRYQMPCSILID